MEEPVKVYLEKERMAMATLPQLSPTIPVIGPLVSVDVSLSLFDNLSPLLRSSRSSTFTHLRLRSPAMRNRYNAPVLDEDGFQLVVHNMKRGPP